MQPLVTLAVTIVCSESHCTKQKHKPNTRMHRLHQMGLQLCKHWLVGGRIRAFSRPVQRVPQNAFFCFVLTSSSTQRPQSVRPPKQQTFKHKYLGHTGQTNTESVERRLLPTLREFRLCRNFSERPPVCQPYTKDSNRGCTPWIPVPRCYHCLASRFPPDVL